MKDWGCRTRVIGDVTGKDTPSGRGNLSFTTLNLPMIAYEAGNTVDFLSLLDTKMDLVVKQLYDRFEYQKSRKANSFKFLYGEGVWKDGKTLDPNDCIGDVLNTGTLSMGFVGLAEALVILTGKHHGESGNSQKLGLDIVKRMRKRMDDEMETSGLNFSLLATPSESYCGKSLRKFKTKYGVVYKVSERDYFTNSFHVPVYHSISAYEKIRLEAPYHELTNAGHITYVEVDGNASKNVQALDRVVRYMAECGIGYGSINHPVDRCRECNFAGVIEGDCPKCESSNISRIRRITGYLVGDMDRWNSAKRAEESERVRHLRG